MIRAVFVLGALLSSLPGFAEPTVYAQDTVWETCDTKFAVPPINESSKAIELLSQNECEVGIYVRQEGLRLMKEKLDAGCNPSDVREEAEALFADKDLSPCMARMSHQTRADLTKAVNKVWPQQKPDFMKRLMPIAAGVLPIRLPF